MILILEEQDVEYYKNDKNIPYMDILYQIYQQFYEFVSNKMCLPPFS